MDDKRLPRSAGVFGIFSLVMASTLLTGCMSIHTAASAGNVGEVRKQLAWGVNPNTRTFWYLDTPLIVGAAYGRTEVVKLLLDKGADVNMGNEGSETPLHYAARHGYTTVMNILLEHGADVSQAGTGCGTPLQWAARNGQIKAAELLLAYDADINQNEGAALHDALSNRQAAMVRLLLDKGADVNIRGKGGCPPLHGTLEDEDPEKNEARRKIRSILQAHGADPTITCDRHNPTIRADAHGQAVRKGFLSRLLTEGIE
ncbi:MAG: ankyrin repeat domain-containing protein [Planctomycetota bacterium]|jgi:ankyrin repeat protein